MLDHDGTETGISRAEHASVGGFSTVPPTVEKPEISPHVGEPEFQWSMGKLVVGVVNVSVSVGGPT